MLTYLKALSEGFKGYHGQHLIIRDHWHIVDLQKYGDPCYDAPLREITSRVCEALVPVLNEVNDREVTKPWLKLTWKYHNALDIRVFPDIVELTAQFLGKEE